MKGYLSIIKYYPDINRDEGFGIGLILISEDAKINLKKFSSDRLRRIYSAYGLKKSDLIEFSIENINKMLIDKKTLEYHSIYENGNLRFTNPQIIETDDFEKKFKELYFKFVADYYEEDSILTQNLRKEIPQRLGYYLRKNLSSNPITKASLNIDYDFKENGISKFLIGSSKIDYIGGNGKIYAGEIINLELSEEALQKSLFKTITLFEALEKSFPSYFSPEDCKILVLESQARDQQKAEYMNKLNTWHEKAKYGLLIKPNIEEFQITIEKEVKERKIKPYTEWIKSL